MRRRFQRNVRRVGLTRAFAGMSTMSTLERRLLPAVLVGVGLTKSRAPPRRWKASAACAVWAWPAARSDASTGASGPMGPRHRFIYHHYPYDAPVARGISWPVNCTVPYGERGRPARLVWCFGGSATGVHDGWRTDPRGRDGSGRAARAPSLRQFTGSAWHIRRRGLSSSDAYTGGDDSIW